MCALFYSRTNILEGVVILIGCIWFDAHFEKKHDFVGLEYEPLTPTGKKAKYPQVVLTNMWTLTNGIDVFNENPFARIYYLEDGRIGKFEIVNWYSHHSCYVAYGKLFDEQLRLNRIETTNKAGKKIILFDRKN